eukprot:COSAG01_NODE_1526_length_10016_cov_8.480085_5_plen_157_part_00
MVGRIALSRSTSTFFGAAGGFFRLWEHPVIFFFAHQWPAQQVEEANISELEFVAADIAATLQFGAETELQQQFGVRGTHYLFQYGDNSSVFTDVVNSMRATSPGMRFLAWRRSISERARKRLFSAAHTERQFITAHRQSQFLFDSNSCISGVTLRW